MDPLPCLWGPGGVSWGGPCLPRGSAFSPISCQGTAQVMAQLPWGHQAKTSGSNTAVHGPTVVMGLSRTYAENKVPCADHCCCRDNSELWMQKASSLGSLL